jgi:hypothetical protein
MNNLEERIYGWFLKRVGRAKSAKVLAKTSIAKLCAEINGDPLEIRRVMDRLRRNGQLEFTAATNGEPISSYITVNCPIEAVVQHAELWKHTLNNYSDLNPAEKLALEPIYMHLEGFSSGDMIILLDGLRALRGAQASHKGDYGFSVSAKYLLGSSKLLSKFESRYLKAFGIDTDLFQDRPPYVVVGGNGEQPEAVILVENPISFEVAVQSEAAKRCAFVCTFGFGLSNHGNEFGYQLAGVVETGNAITLRRTEGSCMDFRTLLGHKNCHFWGDLDSAGMHIFMRLKLRLPLLRLSALYRPMISALGDPHNNHPYVASTGKVGQIPFLAGDPIACELGRLCRERSVCQEIVHPIEIQDLAGKVIDVIDIRNA